jgi:hypothetical protein
LGLTSPIDDPTRVSDSGAADRDSQRKIGLGYRGVDGPKNGLFVGDVDLDENAADIGRHCSSSLFVLIGNGDDRAGFGHCPCAGLAESRSASRDEGGRARQLHSAVTGK